MMNFNNVSDLGETSSLVRDLSIYEDNGTILNDLEWDANKGYKSSGGFNFTGTNYSVGAYRAIELISNPVTNLTENYTLSVWLKPDNIDYGDYEHIINLYGMYDGWLKYAPASKDIMFIIRNGSTHTLYSVNDAFPFNEWHSAIVTKTYDGTYHNLTIFVDGTYNANELVSGELASTDYPTYLGAHPVYGSKKYLAYNGSFDNLVVLDRSLSLSEINQLYMSSLYKYNSTQWYLEINQSKNAIDGLDNGDYSYYAYVKHSDGTPNMTEERSITITS